jgi:putative transposase
MSHYKRWYRESGTYFFTVVTYRRQKLFNDDQARDILREAIGWVRQRHSFDIVGMVLLPEHLHTVWRLPRDDSDFSRRWNMIKRRFTIHWKAAGRFMPSVKSNQRRRRQQGIWQPRFWEHLICDRDDMAGHMDYLHYNPVKHGLAICPHSWPYSTFGRWVKEGAYPENWYCQCRHRLLEVPAFIENIGDVGE